VVNVSTVGSGTHDLAIEVLRFAGLSPRATDGSGDYQVSTSSYRQLLAEPDPGKLPDAVFTVSDLPSPLVRHLVTRHRYQLVPLPFAEAFALDAFSLQADPTRQSGTEGTDVSKFQIFPTIIPAFTYGIEPAAPAEPLPTFGPRLLLVAHESTPPEAIRIVLEAVFSKGFSHFYKPALDPSLLDIAPEYPLHPGTEEYRKHNKPLLAGDVIDLLEKGTSLTGGVLGALFFLWQWTRQHYRRKRELGFESYMVKVAAIEDQALNLETGSTLDLKELLRLQVELNGLKNEALSRFADGKLEGEALMSGFVTYVNNARDYLTRLILHERENLENRAALERRPAEEIWDETMRPDGVNYSEAQTRPD
jgi:hypothetical protein